MVSGEKRIFPDVEAGTKKKKSLPVTLKGTNRPLLIPVFVVRGVEEGPTLLLNAGLHGDELGGIEAVKKVVKDIDPMSLKGTLLAVPVVNIPAWKEQKRNSSEDGLNLNRLFPGSSKGTLSERVAYHFFHKLLLNSDFSLDLHTASYPDRFIPHARIRVLHTPDKVIELLSAFGIELIWKREGAPGMLQVAALSKGIPAVTIELGGGEYRDITLGSDGALNIMRYLGMLEGGYDQSTNLAELAEDRMKIPSPVDGLFQSYVELGSTLMSGSYLGRVTGEDGLEKEIFSPVNGLLAGMCGEGRVKKGKRLYFILPCDV